MSRVDPTKNAKYINIRNSCFDSILVHQCLGFHCCYLSHSKQNFQLNYLQLILHEHLNLRDENLNIEKKNGHSFIFLMASTFDLVTVSSLSVSNFFNLNSISSNFFKSIFFEGQTEKISLTDEFYFYKKKRTNFRSILFIF